MYGIDFMGKRALFVLVFSTFALQAKAVSFMSLSDNLFSESIAFTPLLILGEQAPQDSTIPLAFVLPGYREEDDVSALPNI